MSSLSVRAWVSRHSSISLNSPINHHALISSHLGTETTSFVEIAEFCHYLAKKHEIDGQSADVLTLLTGDDLMHKVTADEYCTDFASILRAIPIKFDRIDKFYGKLIKKWGSWVNHMRTTEDDDGDQWGCPGDYMRQSSIATHRQCIRRSVSSRVELMADEWCDVVHYNAKRSVGRVPTNQPNSPWLQQTHTITHKEVINYESSGGELLQCIYMGEEVL